MLHENLFPNFKPLMNNHTNTFKNLSIKVNILFKETIRVFDFDISVQDVWKLVP